MLKNGIKKLPDGPTLSSVLVLFDTENIHVSNAYRATKDFAIRRYRTSIKSRINYEAYHSFVSSNAIHRDYSNPNVNFIEIKDSGKNIADDAIFERALKAKERRIIIVTNDIELMHRVSSIGNKNVSIICSNREISPMNIYGLNISCII